MRGPLKLLLFVLLAGGGYLLWSWSQGTGIFAAFRQRIESASEAALERLQHGPIVAISDAGGAMRSVTIGVGAAEIDIDTGAGVSKHELRIFEDKNGAPGCQTPADAVTSAFVGGGNDEYVRSFADYIGKDGRHRVEARVELVDGGRIERVVAPPIRSWPGEVDTDWRVLAQMLDLGLVVHYRVDTAEGATRFRVLATDARWQDRALSLEVTGGVWTLSGAIQPQLPDGGEQAVPASLLQAYGEAGVRICVTILRGEAETETANVEAIRIGLSAARR